MRIKNETEILDQKVRKQIIDEINGPENKTRKDDAYRRQMIYRDRTQEFVVEQLIKQFRPETVSQMQYSIANVSILKKIINKMSRVYKYGVSRQVSENQDATAMVSAIEKALEVNKSMRKSERYLKLHKNCAIYVVPCPYEVDGKEYWRLKIDVLPPYLYDVVEEFNDRSKAKIYVLSNYKQEKSLYSQIDAAVANRPVGTSQMVPRNDGKDQIIADSNEDIAPKDEYVFWSRNYHFTCNEHGEIVSSTRVDDKQTLENPAHVLPLVTLSGDQDNGFWADGGADLVQGAVLVNSMITHLNNIAVVQGYGQMYMIGENLPKSVPIGPNVAVQLQYKKDEEAEPKIGFMNASPDLQGTFSVIASYVALLLTTNNMSTSHVSTSLDGSNSFPSGFAMMIDKSELMEDVEDDKDQFQKAEIKLWTIIKRWLDIYREALEEPLSAMALPDGFEQNLTVKMNDPQAILTEKEKLENMQLRVVMGLDSRIDMIMRDNPGMDREMAEAKLREILEDQIKERLTAMDQTQEPQQGDQEQYEDDESDDNGQRDISQS